MAVVAPAPGAWTPLTGDPGLWPYADGGDPTLPFNTYRMGGAVGMYQGAVCIFSVGGRNFQAPAGYAVEHQSRFSIYDPTTDSWVAADGTDDIDNGDGTWTSVGLCGYNNGRGGLSPVADDGVGVVMDQVFYVDGAVYVCGGESTGTVGGKMAKYDIASNVWSYTDELGDDEGVCRVGGGGLVEGHWYKVHTPDYLMRYDCATDTWQPDVHVPGLPVPQPYAPSGVIGRRLLIVDTFDLDNGDGTFGKLYVIDPVVSTLEIKPGPDVAIGQAGSIVWKGKLWLFGGRTAGAADSATDLIQYYDPVIDDWLTAPIRCPNMANEGVPNRSGHVCELIGDTVYLGNGLSDGGVMMNDLWSLNMTSMGLERHGDVDGNGVVDGLDLTGVLTAWATSPGDPMWDPEADLDSSGVVDGLDLAEVISNWSLEAALAPATPSGTAAQEDEPGPERIKNGKGERRGRRATSFGHGH